MHYINSHFTLHFFTLDAWMQDYKFLCIAVMICGNNVNILKTALNYFFN